ncbi:hypothetical protein EJD97_000903, partial [Solanum chilense]
GYGKFAGRCRQLSGDEGDRARDYTLRASEDTMLVGLFTAPTEPLPELRSHSKRHHSSCITEGEDDHLIKKECTNLKAARRASLIDKDTRLMRDREIVVGVSSSRPDDCERITIDGAKVDVGTTKGGLTSDVAGSKKPDPPTC